MKTRWLYILLLVLLMLFLVILHGTLPLVNAPPLPAQASTFGRAKCVADAGNILARTCNRIGYPVGMNFAQGWPEVASVAFFYKYLALPLPDATQIFLSFSIVLGAFSLIWLVWRFTGSWLAGGISAFSFYVSAFLVGNSNYPGLYPGLLLFPFFVGSSLWLFERIFSHVNKLDIPALILQSCLQFIILEFAVFTAAYVYTMAISTIGIFCLAGFVHSLWERKRLDRIWLAVILLYAFLLLAPGIVYRFFAFRTGAPSYSLDFFRGEGIDLITVFVPTQNQWLIARLLQIGPLSWNAHAFYGDGNNANSNFLGYVTPLVSLVLVVLATFKSFGDRKAIITLGVVLAVGFVMSLGPSLKIADMRETGGFQSTLSNYTMPAGDATLSLPTQVLYELPVISTMRATYRWQLLSRFALAALVGMAIAELTRHNKVLASLLCIIIIIESLPAGLLTSQHRFASNRAQGELFNSQVIAPLDSYIQNSRVLFLPAALDYLVPLIVPFTDSYSYNISFDKELVRILPLQPKPITAAEGLFNQGKLGAKDICTLFRKNLVDKVVFTFFDLRWDSYSWPPPQTRIIQYREKAESLKLNEFPGLATSEEQLFLVVSGDSKSGICSPR